MKKHINQLKKLAMECESFAHEFEINAPFTEFRNDNFKLTIYCADYRKTIAVYFAEIGKNTIEVALYSDKITIPMSMTLTEITRYVVQITKLIDVQFSKERISLEERKELLKKARIEALKKELENLQNTNI